MQIWTGLPRVVIFIHLNIYFADQEEQAQQQKQGKQRAHSNAQLGLSGVVSLMMRSQKLTSAEASVLLELIRAENEYVMAAYELYESDEKIDELQVQYAVLAPHLTFMVFSNCSA
jgi:uncharacterized membrane protein YvbJ